MTQDPGAGERRYVRAIEAAWSRIQGRPVVISERDFELVARWRQRGIPLGTVLEVLGDVARRRGGRAPRSLAYVQSAVEHAWESVASGRAAPAASTKPASPPAAAASPWFMTRSSLPEDAPLRRLLDRLLEAAAAGTAPEALDALLDRDIAGASDAKTLERVARDVRGALAAHRGKMAPDELARTYERAVCDALRRAADLPRLTLKR